MLSAGEDFFKDKSDDFSSGGRRSSFTDLSSDRIPMIEKIYQEVLGRKPSSREISFYKYGSVREEEIRAKLLKSDEHLKILEDAKKVPTLEEQVRNLQLVEKKLVQKGQDLGQQIDEVQVLLNEKNSIIQQLREEVKNPYNLNDQLRRYEEGFDIYSTGRREVQVVKERQSFIDFVKELLNMIIK